MRIFVYAIWFPTSKKYYIGQTCNLKGRMKTHLNNNSLVGSALRKYDDWQVSILHVRKTRDEINLLEIECIRNFNSVAPNGYNLTRGGDGANYWKGKKRPNLSKAMQGHKVSLETREKMKAVRKKQKFSKETCKKISEGNKGKKKLGTSVAMKKNNPMKNPVSVLKNRFVAIRNHLRKLGKENETSS